MLQEILDLLDAYLLGEVPLELLEGWLSGNLDQILEEGDWDVQVLVNDLDGDMAEMGRGTLTVEAFTERVRDKVALLRQAMGRG